MKRSLIVATGLVMVLASLSFADKDKEKDSGKKKEHPVFSQEMKSLTGKKVDLSKYKGKVLFIVNTASECGATPQYEQLEELHEKYGDKGLAVLGFPCNQFGKQEPGTSEEIISFCEENYGVKFDMFSKVDVNGEDAPPLYKFLTSDKTGLKDTGDVKWNFEKFLINRDGKVVARFRTPVKPDAPEVIKAVEAELAKK
ncbi:glutathione peroxidase [Symmachiella dynata]|uniref:glutathione peroxidase n=1 Tax=Symmachiella dynata TaxID=2527995 RepID=UPI0030EC2FC4